MQMTKPTKKMIKEWKKIYTENRSVMKPNRKNGVEVNEYFCKKYDYIEIHDKKFEDVVVNNILLNDHNKAKLKGNNIPLVKTYMVKDVYVGIDIQSGFFHIESENMELAEQIYDDMFLFRGLDENDLDNFFLVAEYVQITNK